MFIAHSPEEEIKRKTAFKAHHKELQTYIIKYTNKKRVGHWMPSLENYRMVG